MNFSIHKVLSASLSPNTEADDVFLSFRLLFSPWLWRRGRMVARAEEWFKKNFPSYQVWSYNSGRSALFEILRAFDIGQGNDVLVQAFTCVAVPNSVLWAGAKPVFVDVDGTLNIDFDDAQKKVTPRTRAIILQHTFGIPADVKKAQAFAKRNNLFLIEDCAHSLGVKIDGKFLGNAGDASFFSFGRDKVLSSVFGGIGLIHKKHEKASLKLKQLYKGLPYPSFFWIFQQLLHPVIFAFILPLYTLGIGKVILVVSQRLRLLSFPVYKEEKKSRKPDDFPARYPNALASLLVKQLAKLPKFTAIRKGRSAYYQKRLNNLPGVTLVSYPDESVLLRFPIFVYDQKERILKAKKHGILLGNWYHNCIDPEGVDFSVVGYRKGSCPEAEKYAEGIINLPTLISEKDATIIVKQLSYRS
jgi:dTDP-4-amino-4,6-dideoxygalactose transaminase